MYELRLEGAGAMEKRSSKFSSGRESPPLKRLRMDSEDCDYSKPAIQYHDVTAAAYRIRKGVKETPLEVSTSISSLLIVSVVRGVNG